MNENEIVNVLICKLVSFCIAFQSIKLFAQEDAYIKKLNKIRDQEINHLKMRVYYETFISTLGEISPQWVSHQY